MLYRLEKRIYQLYYEGARNVGPRPDDDSAWFKPDNPKNLKKLSDRAIKFNNGEKDSAVIIGNRGYLSKEEVWRLRITLFPKEVQNARLVY